MKISSEFSKYAQEYSSYNIIQEKVVKKLLANVKSRPKYILDLGCGSGAVCKSIDWDFKKFTGVDFAPGMLELHPKFHNIECIYGDFNDANLFDNLLTYKYDYLFSCSALQWADNLDEVLKNIQQLKVPISLAIFTAGTFKTLNRSAGLNSILRTVEETKKLIDKYFDVTYEVVKYKLEFDSTREMFRYIKKSGVSASRNVLSYTQTKKLMRVYPSNYLEFEVLFIHSL